MYEHVDELCIVLTELRTLHLCVATDLAKRPSRMQNLESILVDVEAFHLAVCAHEELEMIDDNKRKQCRQMMERWKEMPLASSCMHSGVSLGVPRSQR